MRRIGLILTLALGGPCAAADRDEIGTGNARPIPEVRSLQALRKLPPAHGLNGWVLRLGVADSGPEGGPWKLLLCHATCASPAGPTEMSPTNSRLGGAEEIGPLSFTVDTGERSRRSLEELKRLTRRQSSNDSERLYVAPILTAWKGEYFVKVWSEKRKLIQTCRFTVKTPRPCPWVPLARRRAVKTEEDGKLAPLLVPRNVAPAHPKFEREEPIWRLPRDTQIKMLQPAKNGTGPLPGRLPPGSAYEPRYYGNRDQALAEGQVAYPLKLSLQKNTLSLRAHVPVLDSADENLLGRWWVNGKPVLIEPSREQQEQKEVSRQIRRTDEARILLRLGGYLGTLKAGDKVSLQALYCPAGSERISASRGQALLERLEEMSVGDDGAAWQPMLSNKITFDVTRTMLKQRKADAMEPEGTREEEEALTAEDTEDTEGRRRRIRR